MARELQSLPFVTVSTLSFLYLTAVLSAVPAPAVPPTPSPDLDGSWKRLNRYARVLEAEQPSRYRLIRPDIERLRRRNAAAWGVFGSGLALGLGVFVAGVATSPDCPEFDRISDPVAQAEQLVQCQQRSNAYISGFAIGSVVLVGASLGALFGIKPRRRHVEAVVAKLSAAPQVRLRVRPSLPAGRGAGVLLSGRF